MKCKQNHGRLISRAIDVSNRTADRLENIKYVYLCGILLSILSMFRAAINRTIRQSFSPMKMQLNRFVWRPGTTSGDDVVQTFVEIQLHWIRVISSRTQSVRSGLAGEFIDFKSGISNVTQDRKIHIATRNLVTIGHNPGYLQRRLWENHNSCHGERIYCALCNLIKLSHQ